MKKVKFMLLAIAVIAIAGGTLAFKAKYSLSYCTDEARLGAEGYTCEITEGVPPAQFWTATCDVEDQVFTDIVANPITICYTEKNGTQPCNLHPEKTECGTVEVNFEP